MLLPIKTFQFLKFVLRSEGTFKKVNLDETKKNIFIGGFMSWSISELPFIRYFSVLSSNQIYMPDLSSLKNTEVQCNELFYKLMRSKLYLLPDGETDEFYNPEDSKIYNLYRSFWTFLIGKYYYTRSIDFEWNEQNPVNLIGHSLGGAVAMWLEAKLYEQWLFMNGSNDDINDFKLKYKREPKIHFYKLSKDSNGRVLKGDPYQVSPKMIEKTLRIASDNWGHSSLILTGYYNNNEVVAEGIFAPFVNVGYRIVNIISTLCPPINLLFDFKSLSKDFGWDTCPGNLMPHKINDIAFEAEQKFSIKPLNVICCDSQKVGDFEILNVWSSSLASLLLMQFPLMCGIVDDKKLLSDYEHAFRRGPSDGLIPLESQMRNCKDCSICSKKTMIELRDDIVKHNKLVCPGCQNVFVKENHLSIINLADSTGTHQVWECEIAEFLNSPTSTPTQQTDDSTDLANVINVPYKMSKSNLSVSFEEPNKKFKLNKA